MERDEGGLILLGRDYSLGNIICYLLFKAGIRIRIDISSKMDAIDNYNSNHSCKQRRIFRFLPHIFRCFGLKSGMHFEEWTLPLKYASVSWNSLS